MMTDSKFKEDEYKNHFVLKSIICHFCGEPITKLKGRDGDSLVTHSLDGNHNNWAPENKVPTHRKCHTRFHNTGEKNPNFGKHPSEKTRKKLSLAMSGEKNYWFGKRGPETSGFGRTGDKNPMYGRRHTKKAKEEMGRKTKKWWDSLTPEERVEHERKVLEGKRKAKKEGMK